MNISKLILIDLTESSRPKTWIFLWITTENLDLRHQTIATATWTCTQGCARQCWQIQTPIQLGAFLVLMLNCVRLLFLPGDLVSTLTFAIFLDIALVHIFTDFPSPGSALSEGSSFDLSWVYGCCCRCLTCTGWLPAQLL